MTDTSIHPKLNKLFSKTILSDEELKEILALDRDTLFIDLQVMLDLCLEDLPIEEVIAANISYNFVFYALFLLKEIEAVIDFQRIEALLLSSEKSISYWFGELLEHLWIFIYDSGQEYLEDLKELLKKDIDPFCKAQITEAFTQFYLKNEDLKPIIAQYWTELLEFYVQSEETDPLYLAFFVGSIVHPDPKQALLIQELYNRDLIDDTVFGDYSELIQRTPKEKKIYSIFEFNKVLQRHEH